MYLFHILLFTFALTIATDESLFHPLSDEFIQYLNTQQSTWIAGRNFEIDQYGLFEILASGVQIPLDEIIHRQVNLRNDDDDDNIPDSFDSREQWPECAEIIGLVRDQSICGACWAFGAAEAMSDRICIHSNGTRKLLVSSQDILTCVGLGTCDGGLPSTPWMLWSNGIVTGGLYNRTDQGCKSYFLPPCLDHLNKCTNYTDTPKCERECDNPDVDYNATKTYGNSTDIISGEKEIQLEILNNGPVEATYAVYSDFANYKSGIYKKTAGTYVGLHAVKIIGWGVEDNIKYWLILNSWNEHWGENGYFRILRGENECAIETLISKGLPDFSKF